MLFIDDLLPPRIDFRSPASLGGGRRRRPGPELSFKNAGIKSSSSLDFLAMVVDPLSILDDEEREYKAVLFVTS